MNDTNSRASILQDASSRNNAGSTMGSKRRMSFGFSPSTVELAPSSSENASTSSHTLGKKDRRALLDEWRRQRNRNSPSPSISSLSDSSTLSENDTKKQDRFHEDVSQRLDLGLAPPLPPSSASTLHSTNLVGSSLEGTTALQRYRLRRQQEKSQQEQQRHNNENSLNSLMPRQPTSSSSASSPLFGSSGGADDQSSAGAFSGTNSSARKPLRRLSVGGAKKARRKSMSAAHLSSLSLNTPSKVSRAATNEPQLRQATSFDGEKNITSVEGAGLRSRLFEMQQRVEQLEKEKIDLSMQKAPLEARFRQQEDAWRKEKMKLFDEIESLKLAAKESDERYRWLENKHSELQEEQKRLQFEVRRAASAVSSQHMSGSNWTRHIQNDRDVQELKEKLRNSKEEIKALKLEKTSLEADLGGTQMELGVVTRNFNDLEVEYNDLRATNAQANDAAIQLEVLKTEHIATAAQLNAVRSDLAETKSSAQLAMDAAEKKFKTETSNLKFEISVLKTRGDNVDDNHEGTDSIEDDAILRARVEERDSRIAELEAELAKGEQLRRTMHNRIQELRGNIRVFVRTRPFLPGDGNVTESSIDVSRDGENLSIVDKFGKSQQFRFDKAFPPSSGQDSVFEEVSEFVQSALDGYHVCLFSYGQTGSGKTHTMQGSGNNAMRGIIPRAVEQILTQAKVLQSQNWKFSISVSFLEIYNENLKDLLSHMSSSTGSVKNTRKATAPKLAIKRDVNNKSYVDGLTKIKIDAQESSRGMQQLEALMDVAARTRSVSSTKMNLQSSRSHSVFMLHLSGINDETQTVVEGALNLCDLAGSERLDRSGAAADAKTLKETQSINKSLSCLGDVFNALANKAKHVPYRNSKLTYLLQDCLSGDGKALMFVNLSPTVESSGESLCSLRFAQRVNQIELGKPTKHIQYRKR